MKTFEKFYKKEYFSKSEKDPTQSFTLPERVVFKEFLGSASDSLDSLDDSDYYYPHKVYLDNQGINESK